MSDLFRREAIEHQQTRHFGRALIISPLSFKVFVLFVILLTVGICCFFYWGSYTKKKTVKGYILPDKGLVTIHAPQRGTIVARYVQLGERVKRSQKLYQIALQRSTQTTINVNEALIEGFHARLESFRTQIRLIHKLEQRKLKTLAREAKTLQSQKHQLNHQLKTERSIFKLAKKNLNRYNALARKGMGARATAQKVERTMLDRQATVEQLEQKIGTLNAQLTKIPAQKSVAQDNTAKKIADLKNRIAQLKQQELQLKVAQKFIVRAPAAGVISSVIGEVGQSATIQTPLLSILPQGSKFQARLLVPTRAIGFVHTGEVVLLRYQAFPYQRFGLYRGKVKLVSHSIIVPGELPLPVKLKQPYYLVTATLDQPYVAAYGRHMPLTAGMTLSADIVLNHERLYRWLLRPIESLRGPL